ncbi:hypothetical protein EDD85DRAFT_155396 [Armillaria nabsnona]|nr:hypothetical protein EDD85DRAFT_155396 [Armillaria nabsnona]
MRLYRRMAFGFTLLHRTSMSACISRGCGNGDTDLIFKSLLRSIRLAIQIHYLVTNIMRGGCYNSIVSLVFRKGSCYPAAPI